MVPQWLELFEKESSILSNPLLRWSEPEERATAATQLILTAQGEGLSQPRASQLHTSTEIEKPTTCRCGQLFG